MPVGAGRTLLSTRRISKISRQLADIRQLPQNLLFSNRTPMVDAVDEEIMARFDGRIIAADVVADDQKAVVGQDGTLALETTKIPNIKRGTHITQAMLNVLDRINRGGGLPEDEGVFSNHIEWQLENLILGVRQRIEQMLVAMALDTYTYNRLGVSLSVTFGIPSALKVTPSTGWATAASATPIADIMALCEVAKQNYGKVYDRATMSTSAFQLLIATTEFRNKSSGMMQFVFDANTFNTSDLKTMQTVLARLLNLEVELYDAQLNEQAADGSRAATRYLPTTKVILSSKSDDKNGQAYDFANGVVTESIAAMEASSMVDGFSGPERGPVGYATLASPDMNPPGVNLWAVARGFPRLFDQAAFANLTIG